MQSQTASELVSVIMPAYNAEKYIADSIQSVLAQTHRDWELIVVDDGSTDKTAAITKSFAATDNRIKYIYQENGRLGKARNRGINNSKGSLIAFLDSDDLWLKEKLEVQLKTMRETRAGLVFTECFVFEDDDVTNENRTFSTPSGRFQGLDLVDLLLIHNRVAVLSVLVRRDALHKAGMFEEAQPYHGCEDYDLWLKLARNGLVFYGMKDPLVRYRRHSGAMTHHRSNAIKPMIMVVKRHIDHGSLSEIEKGRRIRNLYRELIAALIDESKVTEAMESMDELSAWDKAGVVTSFQRLLIRFWPGKYNFISRECLYRVEWHINKSLGQLGRADV